MNMQGVAIEMMGTVESEVAVKEKLIQLNKSTNVRLLQLWFILMPCFDTHYGKQINSRIYTLCLFQ